MRRAAVLPFIILAAVVVGGLLYLYGGPAFHQTYTESGGTAGPTLPGEQSHFTVLAQGADASGMDARVNYRIQSADQLVELWQMLYTDSGQPVPNVDFNTYEVLALFDGSHTTGGYGIELTSIVDSGGQRVVTITHIEPGDSCVPPGGVTSPFMIIQVPKSSLPITRIEKTQTNQCE